MAGTRDPVIAPHAVARALLELRDALDQAAAALGIAKPLPPVTRARHHVHAAGNLLDIALAGIVESGLRSTGDGAFVEGELLAERYATQRAGVRRGSEWKSVGDTPKAS